MKAGFQTILFDERENQERGGLMNEQGVKRRQPPFFVRFAVMLFIPALLFMAGGAVVSETGGGCRETMAGVGPALLPARGGTGQKTETGSKMLVPLGHTVGIKLFADGVMVVGLSSIETEQGQCTPAADCGIAKGDIITHINGEKIDSTEEIQEIISRLGESTYTVRLLRSGKSIQLDGKSARAESDGTYRLGIWIRDSMAGIGTLTFYDPDSGVFGALGHGINDVDTSLLVPLSSGAIMESNVKAIKRGENGKPGELRGEFNLRKDMGKLYANTDCGIFGTMEECSLTGGSPLPSATRSQVKTGKATILANVLGDEVKEYEIEITKIYPNLGFTTRNLMIRVTDPKLLEATGGIVQGMSGSPILQNGMLIGAVTHVLVNNPREGYGILIENMLEEAFWQEIENVS